MIGYIYILVRCVVGGGKVHAQHLALLPHSGCNLLELLQGVGPRRFGVQIALGEYGAMRIGHYHGYGVVAVNDLEHEVEVGVFVSRGK